MIGDSKQNNYQIVLLVGITFGLEGRPPLQIVAIFQARGTALFEQLTHNGTSVAIQGYR